jgi:peptidoglycan/xylan/chitin deacetylase (PgdA/CDA1 family)
VPETVKFEVSCRGLKRLLHILNTERVVATFFVTAHFAKRNCELLIKILEAGHEIGNHGLEHARKPRRSLKEDIEAIELSTSVIEEIAGVTPCGYREPYLAITKSTIAALMKINYLYDSSIMGTYLPNKNQWITVPSTPFKWQTSLQGRQRNLFEFPLSVFPKLRTPVGWWWFRKNFGEIIPLATANLMFRLYQPFITNIHTWELTAPPVGYRVPFHIASNCGERSVDKFIV